MVSKIKLDLVILKVCFGAPFFTPPTFDPPVMPPTDEPVGPVLSSVDNAGLLTVYTAQKYI